MWVMKWAELLQIRTNPTNQVSYKATLLYYNWLQDSIAQKRAVQRDRPGTALRERRHVHQPGHQLLSDRAATR